MSAIGGIGGASSAWSDVSAARTAMRDKLFSKVDSDSDSDGSGQVDAGELTAMLDKISGGSTDADATATQASALLEKMDTNGDGALDADELDAGMRASDGVVSMQERLAAMVMHQYARFSDATAQQSSSLNVSLAV